MDADADAPRQAPAPCTPLEMTEIGVSLDSHAPEATPAGLMEPSTPGSWLPGDHSKRSAGEPTDDEREPKALRLEVAEPITPAPEPPSPTAARTPDLDGALTDDEAQERDSLVADVVRSAVKSAVDAEAAEAAEAGGGAAGRPRLRVDVNDDTSRAAQALKSPSFNGLSPNSKEAALEAADFFRDMTQGTEPASLPPPAPPTVRFDVGPSGDFLFYSRVACVRDGGRLD